MGFEERENEKSQREKQVEKKKQKEKQRCIQRNTKLKRKRDMKKEPKQSIFWKINRNVANTSEKAQCFPNFLLHSRTILSQASSRLL